jgi:hypothetical protein
MNHMNLETICFTIKVWHFGNSFINVYVFQSKNSIQSLAFSVSAMEMYSPKFLRKIWQNFFSYAEMLFPHQVQKLLERSKSFEIYSFVCYLFKFKAKIDKNKKINVVTWRNHWPKCLMKAYHVKVNSNLVIWERSYFRPLQISLKVAYIF